MAVPSFEKFLYPFLKCLESGDVTLNDMRKELIKKFNLTQEDLQLRTKSGNETQFNDRIGWARQYFRRALFITIPKNGTYSITQRGKDFLKTHETLTIDDLMAYPEYAAFNSSHKSKASRNAHCFITELTPTDQIEQAFENIENNLAADLLAKIMDQSPEFFEHLVVDLLIKMGYGGSFADSAKITQISNDEGIDGIIYEDKLGLDKIYVQAKRWNNPVGRPVIQQFAGALVGQNATKGVFITTSQYSKEAKQYVINLHQKIVLIDGYELSRYMIEYNVGVSTKHIYEVKKIDSDYFEDQ
ncbi:MAG: restriction endonuclease [Paludibacteraceae bacterium]|nr:restriction endonuclease [Paludibacteraceae bacterium]